MHIFLSSPDATVVCLPHSLPHYISPPYSICSHFRSFSTRHAGAQFTEVSHGRQTFFQHPCKSQKKKSPWSLLCVDQRGCAFSLVPSSSSRPLAVFFRFWFLRALPPISDILRVSCLPTVVSLFLFDSLCFVSVMCGSQRESEFLSTKHANKM